MENNDQAQQIFNLHTAARRYCHEQMARFNELKAQPGGVYTVDQNVSQETFLDIMARILFLNSLLWEIQRIVPSNLLSFEQINNLFVEIAEKAATFSRGSQTSETVEKAIHQEHNAFLEYINALSIDKLKLIEPLPHLRVLSDEEHIQLLNGISEKWAVQINGGWFSGNYYPVAVKPDLIEAHLELEAFNLDAILAANVEDIIKKALNNKEDAYICIFEQNYPGIECEISHLDFRRASHHIVSFTFSDRLDWIIFSSSEDTITIGGSWLLEAIKRVWTDWQNHIYEPFDPLN